MRKKLLTLLLVFSMLLSIIPTAAAVSVDKRTGFVAPAGGNYSADDLVSAIVLLKDKPAIDTTARGTKNQTDRIQELACQQAVVQEKMSEKGLSFTVDHCYRALLNGFSVTVPYGDLETIAAIDNVSEVHVSNSYALPEEPASELSANEMTGADDCHAAGYDGAGSTIAILDTGLNTTHEAFQDYKNTEKVITKWSLLNTETRGRYLSAKVPFAYDYADDDNDVTDTNGHGTHVAGIAGGYVLADDGAVTFSGAAPAAQLLIMKIFKDNSSSTSSSIYFAALEDAYLLGADVVNMSLGSQNGFSYDASLDNGIFGNIYDRLEKAGILLCAAAGNEYSMGTFTRNALGHGVLASYADYGVVGTPSTLLNNLSVAAVEAKNYPSYAIEAGGSIFSYRDNSNGIDFHTAFSGKTIPYVIVPNDGALDDYSGLDVNGKIAVVTRGKTSFSDMVLYASGKGAVGLIVCNNTYGTFSMSIDNYYIPAISVTQSAGKILEGEEEKTIFVPEESTVVSNPYGGKMADFSSWGTTSDLRLKPTITAVGGSVYSASYSSDTGYTLKSGTSMATPNAAGCYAVILQAIRQANPDISKPEAAAMANAILESSAQILTDGENPYSPRKQGAGLIDLNHAVNTAIYLTDPMQELGDDPEKKGAYSFSLTIKRPLAECDSHEYEQTILSQASCTADGLAEYICAKCHKRYEEVIPATGHDYHISEKVDATHTVDGYQVFTCANCMDSYRETLPAEGCPASAFTDVDLTRWYHQGIDCVLSHNLFAGIGGNRFAPDQKMTRAMLVTVLYRMAGEPSVEEYELPFTDVTGGWYADAIRWAAANNIVSGIGNGRFDPDGILSREQFAAILYRYAGGSIPAPEGAKALNSFSDSASISAWAQDAMQWAVGNAILQGTGNQRLDPLGDTTRAQAATLLMGYLNMKGEMNGDQPTDDSKSSTSSSATLQSLNIPQQPESATYHVDVAALVDIAETYNNVIYNTTCQKTTPVDVTISCDGKPLQDQLLKFESWETEKTIEVSISLSDSTRRYLDASFENGAFVDGFVTFSSINGGDSVHATFLAFYGDWTQADVLEPYDFADMLRALDVIYEERETSEVVRNIYDVNEMDVDYNQAYIGGMNLYNSLGSNPYAAALHAKYDEAHNYVSNNTSVCGHTALYVYPAQLRNARHLIMTVTDKENGKLYACTDNEYVGKAYYHDSKYGWQPNGFFSWFGNDLYGDDLPDGTEVTVRIYASLDYGEDVLGTISPADLSTLGSDYLEWAFDVTLDNAAPTVETYSFDAETRILTVNARDNHALAYVGALAESGYEYVDIVAGSGSENETHTYTLDLSDYSGSSITLDLEDYASNYVRISISLADCS